MSSSSMFMSSGGPAGMASEGFPDPFCDYASLVMPDTIRDALRWCEYILCAQPVYRQAIDRVVSYFVTDIDIKGASDDEREKYEKYLHEVLQIKKTLRIIALDFITYGNSFVSVIRPFKRFLACQGKMQRDGAEHGCGFQAPLKEVAKNKAYNYKWKGFKFHATCPQCGHSGEWKPIDWRGTQDEVRIKRWSPHEIDLVWDPISEDMRYFWRIPEDYRRLIRDGSLFHLERADWDVVQAIARNEHLAFDADAIYHLKEETLAGIRNRGWGISRVLTNFRQAYYVQVLHRYNESIALDYIIPFRVITPMPRNSTGGGGGMEDPLLSIDLGGFAGQVQHMLRQRRRDPAMWHVLGVPLQYNALGGDAKALAPAELLAQGNDDLLNAVGVPVELYKCTLSVQAAPTALRMFESNWNHLHYGLDGVLRFLARNLARMLSWEEVEMRMARTTHVDDLQRQMALLQLMLGGKVSGRSAMKPMGLDPIEEARAMIDEQKAQQTLMAEAEEQMMREGAVREIMLPGTMPPAAGQPPGAAPPGAAPPAAGAPPPGPVDQAMQSGALGAGSNPQEMLGRADAMAQDLLSRPEGEKDSQLIQLKKTDETMHMLVTKRMEQIREDARRQGGQMLMQQQGMTA